MSDKKGCEPPFWKDLSVLFREFRLQYQPTCHHSKWNFITRIVILSLFLGMIASVVGGLSALVIGILFGGITAFAIVMTTPDPVVIAKKPHGGPTSPAGTPIDDYHALPYTATVDPVGGYQAPLREHFVNGGSSQGSVQPTESPLGQVEVDAHPYSGPALPDYTPPSSRNLFMNVLVDEMKYNPYRPEAAPVDHATVKQTMDDFFRVQWFSDPTDVFGKSQGQRQFVTQPSTTVPNDQGSFADWLYKIPGKTCKEGGREVCASGTDGHIPWMSQTM